MTLLNKQQTAAKNGRKRRASKELTKLLSPKKTHSKKERVLLPIKRTQFTKQGIVQQQQSKKIVEKKECKKDGEPPIKRVKKMSITTRGNKSKLRRGGKRHRKIRGGGFFVPGFNLWPMLIPHTYQKAWGSGAVNSHAPPHNRQFKWINYVPQC